jgi:predicted nucleic acid-binding protein
VNRFVLDASVVLTWCFPDETSQRADEISERIASGDRIVVSAFWRYEVLNALLVGEKRKRITPALTQAFLDDLDRFALLQAWPDGLRCGVLGNSDARNEDIGDG